MALEALHLRPESRFGAEPHEPDAKNTTRIHESGLQVAPSPSNHRAADLTPNPGRWRLDLTGLGLTCLQGFQGPGISATGPPSSLCMGTDPVDSPPGSGFAILTSCCRTFQHGRACVRYTPYSLVTVSCMSHVSCKPPRNPVQIDPTDACNNSHPQESHC